MALIPYKLLIIMTKRLCFIIIACIAVLSSSAQIKALTENGQEVLLMDNGTWKYSNDSSAIVTDSIKVNPKIYSRLKSQSFLVKSKKLDVGIYLNPEKWKVSLPTASETDIEYHFNSRKSDFWAMMIAEKTQIELKELKDLALTNAKDAAPDATIVNAEFRNLNNIRIMCLQINGTIKGIKFVYLGYYYSNENGTVQLITYTSQKLFSESKKEMEEFLNGLVETPKK